MRLLAVLLCSAFAATSPTLRGIIPGAALILSNAGAVLVASTALVPRRFS